MHASIEQLLTLRDAPARSGAMEEAVAGHVDECAECGAELTRLRSLRDEMRGLPQLSPAEDLWPLVAARAGSQSGRVSSGSRSAPWWPLGLAASLLVAVLAALLWPSSGPEAPMQVAVDQPPTSTQTRDLVAESQRLEQILRSVNYRPSVVNAGTADTIAQLEDRIALLDYGLSLGSGNRLTADDTNALWQQRVDLMSSLVQVRAAQARRVDF